MVRVQRYGYSVRARAEVVLDEEDARFVLEELSAHAPNDGFTRDLWRAVEEAWPEVTEDDDRPGLRIVVEMREP